MQITIPSNLWISSEIHEGLFLGSSPLQKSLEEEMDVRISSQESVSRQKDVEIDTLIDGKSCDIGTVIDSDNASVRKSCNITYTYKQFISLSLVSNEIYLFPNILLSFQKAFFPIQMHLQISVSHNQFSVKTRRRYLKFIFFINSKLCSLTFFSSYGNYCVLGQRSLPSSYSH